MISLLLTILFMVIFFKFTGFLFRIAGRVLGWIFGIIGWLFLAGLAAAVLSFAFVAVPIIFIVGIVALISAAANV